MPLRTIRCRVRLLRCVVAILASASASLGAQRASTVDSTYLFNDSHFHLTNYIQRGTDLRAFLGMMDSRVGRVALFGIPLQQQWSEPIDGNRAPTYYLNTDAPLYYYSFTDAMIAMAYRALTPDERARFDPMITGFNPTDMYAADHIRRVLLIFPGVFSGIGEFTIHKEFVSAKVAGGVASLLNPALDSILALAGEIGLVVLMHNDVDVPFATPGSPPAYLDQVRALVARHPNTNLIWAHTGVGRVVRPVRKHVEMVESLIRDPALSHLYFDLSWDVVAKYVVASDSSIAMVADLLNRYPDRFLFGTDVVAPSDAQQYLQVFELYRPLLARLSPAARRQFLRGNYERLFDAARRRVRAWEAAHAK